MKRYLASFLAASAATAALAGSGHALTVHAARTVNAQILANFAPFRRARTAADALPAAIPGHLSCSGPASEGGARWAPVQGLAAWYQIGCFSGPPAGRDRVITELQRNQSRAVRLPNHLGTIWLIPSGRWLCDLFRSRFVLGPGVDAMACEPIGVVLAHPPLWPSGIWGAPSAPFGGAYVFGLEPDSVTKVTLGYVGGTSTKATHLADNVLVACIGNGSSWLEQTGPTIKRTIKTLLGGGKLNGRPTRYRPKRCPRMPKA